jgi:hypothetical protein
MDDLQALHRLLRAEANYQLRSKDECWYKGNLRFLLHEAQRIIYDSYYQKQDKETVILASRRFGKSFLGVVLCLEYAISHPYVITRFVPPEIKQAWQILMPTMGKLEQSWPSGLVRYVATEKAWRIGQNSWLYLGGFDSQKDSQRGGEASLIVCDEAGFTKSEEYNYILKSVLKPQLLTTKGRLVHLSTPSREPDHPFLCETVADAQMEGRLHKFTIYDNPMLTPEDIESAKRDCGGEHTFSWRTEYLCHIVRDGSLMVLPRWNANEMIGKYEPKPWHYRCLVGDAGGVTDKTVLHVLACDYYAASPIVWIIDERVYDSNTTTKEIVAGMKELHAKWIAPSEAPQQDNTPHLDCPGQMQVDINLEHDFFVKLPLKDEFHSSVNLINLYINNGQLFVHERCPFTIMTFNNARFNERRTDYIRTPALGHCDAIASAIYGIRHVEKERDGSPIQRVDKETCAYWKDKTEINNRLAVAQLFSGKRTGVYRVS